MSKPLLIIFEGVDKSGKTTLISEFNKSNDFNYVILDRFLISSIVYDKIFNRGKQDELKNFFKILTKQLRIVIIYCYANSDEIRRRMYQTREILSDELCEINNVEYLFRKTILDLHNEFDFELINIDTYDNSIKECVEILKEKISAIQ